MREFSCRELGYNCSAILTARSEDQLAELASIHLRDVHGMTAITQEKLAQIKNLFVNPSPQDAAAVVDRIFEKYNCSGDPECTQRYITFAETILSSKPLVYAEVAKAA